MVDDGWSCADMNYGVWTGANMACMYVWPGCSSCEGQQGAAVDIYILMGLDMYSMKKGDQYTRSQQHLAPNRIIR